MTAISLTAAQIAQGFSDSARAEIYNVLLAEAVTKGQVLYQTTSGTFGICDMSTVAKDEPRGFALEAGSAGAAISMLKYGPMYGVDLSGEAYDGLVYAGDAGALDDAGTVAVGRVIALADPSKTKVLFVDCREQPVDLGWLRLDAVGYMKAGTYSSPVESAEAGETFHEFWLKCSGDGHVYGLRFNVQVSGASATSSNAGRFELDLTAGAGAAPSAAAIHSATDLAAGYTGTSGVQAGLNASMLIGADSRALIGKFASILLQSQIGLGNTFAENGSFIACLDASSVKWPFFLDVEELVTGAGNAYVNGTHAGSTVGGVLRVAAPFGTGYIKLYSD